MAFTTTFFGAKPAASVARFDMANTCVAAPQQTGTEMSARKFKVTVVMPAKKTGEVRDQTVALFTNTYYTKYVDFSNWFAEQQKIQKAGGKILKVKLANGNRWTVGNA
uniref:Core linker Lc7.8 n=1 Tax=Cyanophora paradoxa TaxID=2762 RepID=Q8GUE6_CYAPA|nr:core linker Lc7.8 [Cyanophora paradoxa]